MSEYELEKNGNRYKFNITLNNKYIDSKLTPINDIAYFIFFFS